MASGMRKRRVIICAALAMVSGAMMLFYAFGLYDASRFNDELLAGRYTRAGEHASLHGRFANAFSLHRAGRFDEALKHYAQVEEAADGMLRQVAMFNLSTLYLERALTSAQYGRDVSLPLIELAKEGYRQLLRTDSSDWDAKYNLELAIRLSPEPEDEEVEETVTPERTPRAPRAPLGYGGLP